MWNIPSTRLVAGRKGPYRGLCPGVPARAVAESSISQGAIIVSRTLRRAAGLVLTGLLACGAAAAEEHVVTQKNKAFSAKKLKVKVGDSIKFANEDSFAHNVFSLSATKSFDTGSFGSGQARSVSFDKPGAVEVECAVHPEMRLDVEVAP